MTILDALKIAAVETPVYFITSAIHYRFRCVELALKNHDFVKLVKNLQELLSISSQNTYPSSP